MSRILENKDKFIPLVIDHVQQIHREAKTRDAQEIVDLTQLVILECSLLVAAMAGRDMAKALMVRIGEHLIDPGTRLPNFEEHHVGSAPVGESKTVN